MPSSYWSFVHKNVDSLLLLVLQDNGIEKLADFDVFVSVFVAFIDANQPIVRHFISLCLFQQTFEIDINLVVEFPMQLPVFDGGRA